MSSPKPPHRRSPSRLALLLLVVLAGAMLLTSRAPAAPLPPQGLYEECPPAERTRCADELAQMADGGFRLALNYTAWYGGASDIAAYAATAARDGMQIIWPLNFHAWRERARGRSLPRTYNSLARSCRCARNDAFVRYAVRLVRDLPATWGYYIGDELGMRDAPAVTALAATLRLLDPRHPLLYVGVGQSAPGSLVPFAASADVIAGDVYPIGAGESTATVSTVAGTVRALATFAHRQAAVVLQSFSWAQHPTEIVAIRPRWPTEPELQQMRDDALAASPAMILWYDLADIERSAHPRTHWDALVTAAFAPPPLTAVPATAGRGPRGR